MKSLIYADSSAILRVVFDEPGARLPLAGAHAFATSRLTLVESARAIERARLAGAIDDDTTVDAQAAVADLISRMHVLVLDEEVFRLAQQPFGVAVRSLDALHVASAQRLVAIARAPVIVWTHDDRMAAAASARGLQVAGCAQT